MSILPVAFLSEEILNYVRGSYGAFLFCNSNPAFKLVLTN